MRTYIYIYITTAIAGSPMFMIKCRIQAQTSVNTIKVGTQHSYLGMMDGFRHVIQEEGKQT